MTKDQAIQLKSVVKTVAYYVAKSFKQSAEDLVSEFYYHLLKTERFECRSVKDLKNFANRCMQNLAINRYRKMKRLSIERIDFVSETEKLDIPVQKDHELCDIAEIILSGLRTELSKKGTVWVIIYDEVVLGQMKYREVAELVGIPIGTVKTKVHVIRKIAEKKYGQMYRQLHFTDNKEVA